PSVPAGHRLARPRAAAVRVAMLPLKFGVPYTRTQIQAFVGGELTTYLPQRDHRILAGCFARDLNPKAPDIVFAGNKAKVAHKARLLARQPDNCFPVFVRDNKRAPYFFQGYFAYERLSDLAEDIRSAEALSGRYNQLSCVLHLKRCPDRE
ncbi:MAG TPA: hypothetical protein PKZ20_14740, partial [Rhodocyclaceae bacterium]|nr:hypothetical protein [Rhodocyclaceae bacterium]